MFSWIAKAYNWAIGKVDPIAASWVHDILSVLYGFLHGLFGTIISAWNLLYKGWQTVERGLDIFGSAVASAFHHLWQVWLPQFLKWISAHILKPLETAITWIGREGRILWFYITHPDKLVDLIWDHLLAKLETTIDTTSKKLGSFALSWITHHLKDFVILIEDIIHAVL